MSKPRIKSDNQKIKLLCKAKEEKPAISFEYLTSNKKYNFDCFGKSAADERKAKAKLLDRLVEITQRPWIYWNGQPKKTGLETFSANELNFSPFGYSFTSDEKVIIFRFDGDYRIIGFKDGATLYIIGFDFDYSAYNHGS